MIIQTKTFQEAANKILLAVSTDKTNAANVELEAKDNVLYLRTTNKEFYVEIKFDLESAETFRAVVDANLFLNLISSITTDTFEITINENVTINTLLVKAGKSNLIKSDNLFWWSIATCRPEFISVIPITAIDPVAARIIHFCITFPLPQTSPTSENSIATSKSLAAFPADEYRIGAKFCKVISIIFLNPKFKSKPVPSSALMAASWPFSSKAWYNPCATVLASVALDTGQKRTITIRLINKRIRRWKNILFK